MHQSHNVSTETLASKTISSGADKGTRTDLSDVHLPEQTEKAIRHWSSVYH